MSCCRISAGELKHHVVVSAKTLAPDAVGGASVSWSQRCDFWCAMKQLSAFEAQRYGALQNEVLMAFRTRYADAVSVQPTDKITYRGREYNIRSIENEEEADEVMRIVAERGVAQ